MHSDGKEKFNITRPDANRYSFAEEAARSAESMHPQYSSAEIALYAAIKSFAEKRNLSFKEAVECIVEATEKVFQ